MTDRWSHQEPVEIRFGTGCLEELPAYTRTGDRVLLVTSAGMTRRGVTHRVEELLEEKQLIRFDEVAPNPSHEAVEAARARLVDERVDKIVAVGGGSVLDTAKALSLILRPANADISLEDHFQQGTRWAETVPLPLITVPTTAGTGSEVTPFGTLWDTRLKKKTSITTPHLHPRAALLDPELTLDLPPHVTLTSGLDALSHAMESVWNRNATPITRMYAERAVTSILAHLKNAVDDPTPADRWAMLEASLLAGLAIARTRTALAHSISYPLTARHGLTHGYACSFTLPALLRYNAPEVPALEGFAQKLGFPDVEALAGRIERLYQETGAATEVAKTLEDLEALQAHVDEMFDPQRAGNNARTPDRDAVLAVLKESATRVLGL